MSLQEADTQFWGEGEILRNPQVLVDSQSIASNKPMSARQNDSKATLPDVIAHTLLTNTGSPIRIYPTNEELTVPVEPYETHSPETVTVPVKSFDAVVENAYVEDGGLTFSGYSGIHIPESEWERIGLQKHWEHDATDLASPMTDASRKLDLWASREPEFYDAEPDDYEYGHLDPIPDDSPLITEWSGYQDDDLEKPPVPLEPPELTLYVLHGEDSDHDPQGFDRVNITEIAGVEVLDEDEIVEWPESPNIEKRELDVSPPSRHPEIDYASIEPLPVEDKILEAVYTINRYAKQFDEQADEAYRMRDGAQARVFSVKKKALYQAKTVAVHRLAKASEGIVRVTRHILNGDHEMFCVYFGSEYSFHQPLGAVEEELLDDVQYDAAADAKVIDFDTPTKTDALDVSLSEALSILSENAINANEYLETKSVKDFEWGYRTSTKFDI